MTPRPVVLQLALLEYTVLQSEAVTCVFSDMFLQRVAKATLVVTHRTAKWELS